MRTIITVYKNFSLKNNDIKKLKSTITDNLK